MARYSEAYQALCHRKAILEHLVETLRGTLPDSLALLPEIYSEDLPYALRQVSTTAVNQVIQELVEQIDALVNQINQYEVTLDVSPQPAKQAEEGSREADEGSS
jgi:hypothetical protein